LIKVLNVITDTNIGGAGNVLLNFMKKTDRSEFDHTVIVPKGAMLSPRLRKLEIRTVEMHGIEDRSFSTGAIGVLRRKYELIAPDVAHTHASLSARIAARLWGGCAVIHTRHCAYPQGRLKTSFPFKQVLGFMNNRLSDKIIAISPAARDNLTDTGTDPHKIVTMFNGVEAVRRLDSEEKAAVRSSLGIGDEFVCASIARLVPEKGHEYILNAAELLKDLPIRFIIAGTGPSECTLRIAAADRRLDNCIFTGFVSDIAPIENIMDLQLNASYGTETSSLSLLEGMSLGVPSVASDFGGNPYLVTDGENGLVVPKCNGAAMADAIRKLFSSPKTLAQMGKAALSAYEERFDATIMAKNIEQVYREAVVEKRKEENGKRKTVNGKQHEEN
jgi:glycosyltransferase involved in cell wall biosynthesis